VARLAYGLTNHNHCTTYMAESVDCVLSHLSYALSAVTREYHEAFQISHQLTKLQASAQELTAPNMCCWQSPVCTSSMQPRQRRWTKLMPALTPCAAAC